ncbi:unnamed protein product [Durusdinium trenchii]|uniref:Homologous-pairing protein 2 winged helix domain-containing protein n=1 Tax=Durusdinium trenchii TaxID=1381693 RepID=A0ABP0NMS4_9DINO
MEVKVLEYMRQQNRPYNAQNVFDNLHGAVPKGSVQAIWVPNDREGSLGSFTRSESVCWLSIRFFHPLDLCDSGDLWVSSGRWQSTMVSAGLVSPLGGRPQLFTADR